MTLSGRHVVRRTSADQVREEFDRFVTSAAADLLHLAYLVVWDLSAAEDVVQECLLRVARRWPRVRRMERRDAYTRRVLVNLAIDDVSRNRRRRDELDHHGVEGAGTPDVAVGTSLEAVDLRHELVDALGHLAPRQRAVLVLRYFADMTEEQAAEVLDCSVGTVKSTASRALERMREHYDVVPRSELSAAERVAVGTHTNGRHNPTNESEQR